MPKVSILIPVYNTEKYLAQTIQSVINQSYSDWELIILDDSSTDNSYEIALDFASKDERIKLYRNECNLGMMENWNKGISLCSSEFFVKLDADDLWHPMILEKSLSILEHLPDVGMVFTRYVKIDEYGKVIDKTDSSLPDFAADKEFSCVSLVQMGAGKMLQYDILRQGISLLRREVFEVVRKYKYLLSKETQASVDTEFYFRLGCHYKIYGINKTYYHYRIHSTSISAIDRSNNLNAKKLYEIKIIIINYYYNQGKINKSLKKNSLKDTQFHYNSFLLYQARVEKRFLLMSKLLIYNTIINPKRMFIENLHIDRLWM